MGRAKMRLAYHKYLVIVEGKETCGKDQKRVSTLIVNMRGDCYSMILELEGISFAVVFV
jgi:hypothetical protein